MNEIYFKEVPGKIQPKIFTLEFRQDDPAKCTSAKMRKFGFARPLVSERRIPRSSIILNPTSQVPLLNIDRESILNSGLVVIDCSWKVASSIFSRRFRGFQRRLPVLLAGNPTNYARAGLLSSLEASAAALYITGFKVEAERLLSLYKWGPTFLTLNSNPLEDYSGATDPAQISEIERAYFQIAP